MVYIYHKVKDLNKLLVYQWNIRIENYLYLLNLCKNQFYLDQI